MKKMLTIVSALTLPVLLGVGCQKSSDNTYTSETAGGMNRNADLAAPTTAQTGVYPSTTSNTTTPGTPATR